MKNIFKSLTLVFLFQSCMVQHHFDVTGFGVFDTNGIERTESDITITGYESESNTAKLIQETHVLYMDDIESGQFFGFNYVIEKLKKNQYESLDLINYYLIIRSPPITNKNGETVTEQTENLTGLSGIETYYGYVFSEEWEKVPGIWAFEFYVKGDLIGKISFDVRAGSCTDSEKQLLCENPDVVPSFVGGEMAMMKYLETNVVYPEAAVEAGINGQVIIGFIVDELGELSHFKIVKSTGTVLDKEALRLVRNMPLWNPGEKEGQTVCTRFSVPVNFRL